MALSNDERRALRTRLAPGGDVTADAVARAVEEGEELREVVVDGQGDVVAFTDRRALFVADGSDEVVTVGYADIEVRRRDHGLAIDALIEGGRLILDVARGTFVRLAIVGTGAPPGRASWLPVRVVERREPAAPRHLPPVPPVALEPTGPTTVGAPSPATAGDAPTFPAAPPTVAGGPAPTPSQAPTPPVPPIPPVEPVEPIAAAPLPPVAPALPTAPPAGLPPAGWNPDPSGRHWWRWWDGMSWTDHVADGGATFRDPLPPRI